MFSKQVIAAKEASLARRGRPFLGPLVANGVQVSAASLLNAGRFA